MAELSYREAVAYGIAQRHHGRIDVDSVPGHGATFTVYLPLRQPSETELEEEVEAR